MEQIPPHERRRLEAIAGPANHWRSSCPGVSEGSRCKYIEGSAPFGPLDLVVDERVLVPRPETEGLYETATRMVRNPEVIVDLCTGSGALALALKKAFLSAAVFATDISEDASGAGEGRRRAGRPERARWAPVAARRRSAFTTTRTIG